MLISLVIMKIIDERERCDIRCFVMRWSKLALWIILKQRELYESKQGLVECQGIS